MNKSKSFIVYLFLISLVITLDQGLKRWALNVLQVGNENPVNSWLNFTLASNRGISWGLLNFQADLYFYILTALIIFIILGFFIYSVIQHLNRSLIYFESMVIGGAISNVIDRINYGYVIDFIDLHIAAWHWPTFNVADTFIIIGVVGMLFNAFYEK